MDPAYLDIYQSTNAVVFLGTPHRGSPIATVGNTIARIVHAAGFDTEDKNIRALRFESPELERCQEEFSSLWRSGRFAVKTFQEELGMAGVQGLNEKV